ncbi:MAG: putative N-acyltransferase [Pseudohongiellaceae bacterium]
MFDTPFSGELLSTQPTDIFHLHFLTSIKEIDAAEWNALAGKDYPFMQHAFFLALEQSNSTSAITGWQPYHVVIKKCADGDDENDEESMATVAIMPLFLKDNSQGEYVFDWSWADAYQRHGLDYYPKFVTAIPFTPCPGARICVAEDQDVGEIHRLLCQTIPQQAKKINVSSWHVLFPQQEESDALATLGIQSRVGCQYQWFNKGYSNFDDFLARFSSRKRKNIRKERQKICDAGIEFEFLEGPDIQSSHWDSFYQFYQSTYFVRGRSPYLTTQFFTEIGNSMPENLLLVLAKKDGEYIAGALSFVGADTLYGRYWGCTEEYQFLHFETCYYQGIDYCIDRGLQRFDSGAQGEHKIQRGFEPVLTCSNHWIAHTEFDQAIGRFLEDEEQYIRRYQKEASAHLPFKADD